MARYQLLPDAGWVCDHETDTSFHDQSLHLSCAQDYQTWLADGNVPDPVDPAWVPPVPVSVSPAQGRLALLQSGDLDALEDWVATQPKATQIEYTQRGEWRRDWPLVATGAAALGLTDAQMDDLFRLADTL